MQDVIKYLMDKVFKKNFKKADPALRALGSEVAFLYSSCVLFPETFIQQHIVGCSLCIS